MELPDPFAKEVVIEYQDQFGLKYKVEIPIDSEQAIRDRFAYAKSETRTLLERQVVANRIRENLGISLNTSSREEAIDFGRQLGEDTARSVREVKSDGSFT